MRISDTLFCVVDSETTGLDPKVDDLLEIGALYTDASGAIGRTFSTLVAPTKPIAPDNSAIHGLIDEDFVAAPSLYRAFDKFLDFAGFGAVPWTEPVYAMHNARFDLGFLPILAGRRVLCTKRLAGHLCPDAPNTKNQTLRYFFADVARRPEIRAIGDAHRALSDAKVTAAILPKLIERYIAAGQPDDIDALIAFADSPVRVTKMPIGKFRGELLSDLAQTHDGRDYMGWMLRSMSDLDPDLRWSIEGALGIRSVPA